MLQTTDKDLFFAKMRENAIIPSKKDEDAGFDMYACFDGDFFVIDPFSTRVVPTGIAAAFSKKYYAQIEERSSMAKLGIKKSGGVFDSGYRGEYLICTYNTHDIPFIISKIDADELPETFEAEGKTYEKSKVMIYPYKKAICQMVLQEIPALEVKELSYEELKGISSERGAGGFGHSNK